MWLVSMTGLKTFAVGDNMAAHHGRITKQGRGHVRGILVEAAWAAARAPGPLRALFLRVRARRGQHVAAVATARKLAEAVRGQKGAAHAYNIRSDRQQERRWV